MNVAYGTKFGSKRAYFGWIVYRHNIIMTQQHLHNLGVQQRLENMYIHCGGCAFENEIKSQIKLSLIWSHFTSSTPPQFQNSGYNSTFC